MKRDESEVRDDNGDDLYQRARLVVCALVLLGAVVLVRFGAGWF